MKNDESGLHRNQIDPFSVSSHPMCVRAVEELQLYLLSRNGWSREFGLDEKQPANSRAKMFGVLVVENNNGELGYLAAFSGKLIQNNHHDGFVPPVFDSLAEDGFLNKGMKKLDSLSTLLKEMLNAGQQQASEAVIDVRSTRKQLSNSLQTQLHNSYVFLNSRGEEKSLKAIFRDGPGQNPPSAAGECAAPKLFQLAHHHGLIPIALNEFWWGKSNRSKDFEHKGFYPACEEKCRPILEFMLG